MVLSRRRLALQEDAQLSPAGQCRLPQRPQPLTTLQPSENSFSTSREGYSRFFITFFLGFCQRTFLMVGRSLMDPSGTSCFACSCMQDTQFGEYERRKQSNIRGPNRCLPECLPGKSMTPYRKTLFLFCSSQQLPCFCLKLSKEFLS